MQYYEKFYDYAFIYQILLFRFSFNVNTRLIKNRFCTAIHTSQDNESNKEYSLLIIYNYTKRELYYML